MCRLAKQLLDTTLLGGFPLPEAQVLVHSFLKSQNALRLKPDRLLVRIPHPLSKTSPFNNFVLVMNVPLAGMEMVM